jgi:hypothetical protein
VTAWTCSVCGLGGTGVCRRCKCCNSIACETCLRAGSCTNCQIEEGDRWFSPAAEEPIGRLPKSLPLGLLALVLFGPVLIVVVAELMGRMQSLAPPLPIGSPVHFVGQTRGSPQK